MSNKITLNPKPGKLHGFLYDITTNQPISYAIIAVSGYMAISGENGEFTVVADAGTQKVAINHPSYQTKIITVEISMNRLKELEDVQLYPKPGTITGVTSPGNCEITLSGDVEDYTTTSDSQGNFVIDEVLPGAYTLKVDKDNYYTAERSNVIVRLGQVLELGIISLKPEVGFITGRILNNIGVGVQNAIVNSSNSTANTDEDGNFELTVISGTHNVTIVANGYEDEIIGGVEVEPNLVTNIGAIELKSLESGLGNITVGAINLMGETIDASFEIIETGATITPADDSLTFKDLPIGPYSIKATSENYYNNIKEVVVISDKTTTVTFTMIEKSSLVDDLASQLEQLTSRTSQYWEQEIGYPREEFASVEEIFIDTNDSKIKYKLTTIGDKYVGRPTELNPNIFFDFTDKQYNELIDKDGNPITIIDVLDENDMSLLGVDETENPRPTWYGKESGEEIYLVLSDMPEEEIDEFRISMAVHVLLKDMAIDALIKRGVTSKQIDINIVDAITDLKGINWEEPVPSGMDMQSVYGKVTAHDDSISNHTTSINQNAETISQIATRVDNTEEGLSTYQTKTDQNADSITSIASDVDINTEGITANEGQLKIQADRIAQTLKSIQMNRDSGLRISGTNEHAVLMENPLVQITDTITIEFKIMFYKTAGTIFARDANSLRFYLDLNSSLRIVNTYAGIDYNWDTGFIPEENIPYKISWSYNSTTGEEKLYIDGILYSERAIDNGGEIDNSGNLYFGEYNFDEPRNKDFLFSEFTIWNIEKSPGKIEDDYNKELTGSEEGLVLFYKFNDYPENTIFDYTGNGLNAEINGAKWFGISASSSQIEQLSNEYTVKIQSHQNGKNVISGFGLINKGGSSEFSVMADNFYIYGDTTNPDEPGTPVFAVKTDESGNMQGIYLNANMIVDGSIDANKLATSELITSDAQIKDGIITNAKIGSLHASKITAGTIDAARISVGKNTTFAEGYNPTEIESALNKDIAELQSADSTIKKNLEQFTLDSKLSRLEANEIRANWNNAKAEYDTLLNVVSTIIGQVSNNDEMDDSLISDLSAKKSAYTAALDDLELELQTWVELTDNASYNYPLEITSSDRQTILTKFQNAQNAKAEILNSLTDYRERAAAAYADSEINTAREDLQLSIDMFSKDSVITRAEANALEVNYEKYQDERADLIDLTNNLINSGYSDILNDEKEAYQTAMYNLNEEISKWINNDPDNPKEYPIENITATDRSNIISCFRELEKTKSNLINKISYVQSDQKAVEAKDFTLEKVEDKMRLKPKGAILFHFDKHLSSTDGIVAKPIIN